MCLEVITNRAESMSYEMVFHGTRRRVRELVPKRVLLRRCGTSATESAFFFPGAAAPTYEKMAA
jgi:hypothetical protein